MHVHVTVDEPRHDDDDDDDDVPPHVYSQTTCMGGRLSFTFSLTIDMAKKAKKTFLNTGWRKKARPVGRCDVCDQCSTIIQFKIYSPFGKFSERAKKNYILISNVDLSPKIIFNVLVCPELSKRALYVPTAFIYIYNRI